MMTDPDSVINPIKAALRWLIIGTVALYIVVITVGGLAYLHAFASEKALCALRADLEKRVEGSEAFLMQHPKGIPGIPAKAIRDGLINQKRTVKALQELSCPAGNLFP